MKKQHGGVFLLLALVLIFAVGTPLLLRILTVVTMKAGYPSATIQTMATVDVALLAFVSSNRRLPCPADGALPSGTAGAGREARDVNGDCTAAQTRGVVPWGSLGLAESAITDAWGGRLTYRVVTGPTGLTRDSALDATLCDYTGTSPVLAPALATSAVSCLATCVTPLPPAKLDPSTCNPPAVFVASRGLWVVNELGVAIANPAVGTGAAYVLISHGPEGGGAYTSNGILNANSVAAGGNGEIRNLNNQGIPGAGYFDSASVQTGTDAGAAHFDDLLSHPSISDILAKTGLGARYH